MFHFLLEFACTTCAAAVGCPQRQIIAPMMDQAKIYRYPRFLIKSGISEDSNWFLCVNLWKV